MIHSGEPEGPTGTGPDGPTQAAPLLVSILTKDGLDAGPTAQTVLLHWSSRRAQGVCAQPLGAWVVTPTLVFGDAAVPVSPPGLRCAFRSLPAFLVGLARSRLVTCGQGACRQHLSEIQVRMFPGVWTNAPWEVGRECCLASCWGTCKLILGVL